MVVIFIFIRFCVHGECDVMIKVEMWKCVDICLFICRLDFYFVVLYYFNDFE